MLEEQPVFAFTVHRSGGTLLGRLLNCHPDLVVWGEHSGLVENLAQIDFLLKKNQELLRWQSGDDAWLKNFASDPVFRSTHMQPWTMPPHLEEARTHARQMIRGIFTQYLRPDQRWGFKEIRYQRPYMADYLLELFPDARFVLLSRDVEDAAVSNILSDWSQDGIKGSVSAETEESAEEIIEDVVYALIAAQVGLGWIRTKHPARCFEVNYSALKRKDVAVARAMLEFVGLEVTPEVEQNLSNTFEIKFNETRKIPKLSKILTADYIRHRAGEIAPAMRAEIAAKGVDKARLVSTVAPGKYSFLTGTNRSSYVRF